MTKNKSTEAGEWTHEITCLAGIDPSAHECTCGNRSVTKPFDPGKVPNVTIIDDQLGIDLTGCVGCSGIHYRLSQKLHGDGCHVVAWVGFGGFETVTVRNELLERFVFQASSR